MSELAQEEGDSLSRSLGETFLCSCLASILVTLLWHKLSINSTWYQRIKGNIKNKKLTCENILFWLLQISFFLVEICCSDFKIPPCLKHTPWSESFKSLVLNALDTLFWFPRSAVLTSTIPRFDWPRYLVPTDVAKILYYYYYFINGLNWNCSGSNISISFLLLWIHCFHCCGSIGLSSKDPLFWIFYFLLLLPIHCSEYYRWPVLAITHRLFLVLQIHYAYWLLHCYILIVLIRHIQGSDCYVSSVVIATDPLFSMLQISFSWINLISTSDRTRKMPTGGISGVNGQF